MVMFLNIHKILNDKVYLEYIAELLNEKTLSLHKFTHHKNTTRFLHSLDVSYKNYRVCKFLNLDARSAARAGLLHDYFFYDRKLTNKKSHMKNHPLIAFTNASANFSISQKEKFIILQHMWPLTPKFPQSPEGVVTTIIDKYCAVTEFFNIQNKK